jgi:hypothetical protein
MAERRDEGKEDPMPIVRTKPSEFLVAAERGGS